MFTYAEHSFMRRFAMNKKENKRMMEILQPSAETQERVNYQNLQDQEELEKLLQKKARESPFSRFYQINKKNSHFLTDMSVENPKALGVLLFIYEQMDNLNSVSFSYKVIQERLHIGRTTASNCVKYLREHGFIYVYKAGTTNVYVSNPEMSWQTYGNRVAQCKFPTNVILSLSEQEKMPDGKFVNTRLNQISFEEQQKTGEAPETPTDASDLTPIKSEAAS